MLIHCTMDELIAIRDGQGTQGALRHLDDCQECRDELDLLHQRIAALRALPAIRPPRDRWDAVRGGILAARSRRRREAARWVALAAAASIALSVGLSRLIPMATVTPDGRTEELAGLVQEAEALGSVLRTIEPSNRVVSGRVASAIATLEDRLVLVDTRLAEARVVRVPVHDMIVLMQERVELMDALVRVHHARRTYIGF